MPGAFHGEVPGPVWPDEDSHSPWTDFRGPRHEQLRLAHLRGDLAALLPAGKDGNGYQVSPDLLLNRRSGRRQWSYSLSCRELECRLKARQAYEQQSGEATYSLGAAFWELRSSKG